jgi:hypothetical protein
MELLITIWLAVKDQQPLLTLPRPAVAFGAHENPRLQGHVEAWKLVDSIELGAREVMNAVPTLLNETVQLLAAGLSPVVKLTSRSGEEAAGANPENQGSKGFGVVVVKRTVDEDVVRRGNGQSSVEGKGL